MLEEYNTLATKHSNLQEKYADIKAKYVKYKFLATKYVEKYSKLREAIDFECSEKEVEKLRKMGFKI